MKALPILMYHHVSPAPGLVTISPAIFREHLGYLAQSGWRTAGLTEVGDFFAGRPLPAKTCVITFDDGYLDNYVYAHPVLAEFGMKAAIFVVTGWLGDGSPRAAMPPADHNACKAAIAAGNADAVMLRWSEIEAMAAAGTAEFHSHTHRHTRWDREIADPAARRDALADDLRQSHAALQGRLGAATRHLAWPQGYYDDAYLAAARAVGFDHCYTTERRSNRPGGDVARIGRIDTKERSGAWLVSRLGLYARPWLGALYGWLR